MNKTNVFVIILIALILVVIILIPDPNHTTAVIAEKLCYPNIMITHFSNNDGKVVAVCAAENGQYVNKIQP